MNENEHPGGSSRYIWENWLIQVEDIIQCCISYLHIVLQKSLYEHEILF